ncbi:adenosylmethionine decarboxylase [Mucor mucedo]|uniref:adenosylmethionine decarboxylase n=1 Tax=Mucor mucedo TaxID=29922 RepID=UPI00221EE50E|nr:adenosylmethionine decarboxylase [Mucor mucedo]KAI7865642.1 adenosylmethionine decarboxylase [Mucor mucedo]
MVNTTNTTAANAIPASGENYSIQEGAFEGPEKLLEIWFSPSAERLRAHQNLSSSEESSDTDLETSERTNRNTRRRSYAAVEGKTGLRVIPKAVLDKMLALVKCTVLNVISNEYVDAYVLSESSMFVYPHKIILKTCGTTTLLLAVSRLLEIAKSYCGFEKVWRVFYSRKSFLFPERQVGPHRSWEEEVAFLDGFFDAGSSYKIGKETQDQWHLYLTKPSDDVLSHSVSSVVPHHLRGVMQEHEIQSGASTPVTSDTEDLSPFGNAGYSFPDQTVEIHMTGLNQENMKKFYHDIKQTPSGSIGGQWVDKETGIDQLYPLANIDSYLFEPCGYSSNGLWEDRYFTFHVTPEDECSYASFESNIPVEKSHANMGEQSPIEALITRVLDIFDPSSFTVTYFTSHHKEHHSHSQMVRSMTLLNGYKRTNRILYEFDGYDLVYGHYAK